jgi:crossover junction endodeoxyribonuclease RusA
MTGFPRKRYGSDYSPPRLDAREGDEPMRAMIELPFPHKILWPNGRTQSRGFKAAETKKHRAWGAIATREVMRGFEPDAGDILVNVTCHPKPSGPLPDRDNVLSACKAFLDGIADALGVNDRRFVPTVAFGERVKHGKIVVVIA